MRSDLRSVILGLAVAIFAAAAAQAPAQSADAGLGTWKLNVAKSRFSPGPAPQALTTKFEPAGPGVRWSSERTGLDGKILTSEYTASYDGKDYPLKGSPAADAVSLRRIDALTTERVNKKDGKVVSTETRSVAPDGKSYTTSVKGTTAKGEPIDVLMVFEKQ